MESLKISLEQFGSVLKAAPAASMESGPYEKLQTFVLYLTHSLAFISRFSIYRKLTSIQVSLEGLCRDYRVVQGIRAGDITSKVKQYVHEIEQALLAYQVLQP